jgi:hypothetical protein
MAFTLGFVSFYLKVSDPMVGILGCLSQVLGSICVAIAPTVDMEWLLYLGNILK